MNRQDSLFNFSSSLFLIFWQQHPALLYALMALLGSALALSQETSVLLLPLALIIASLLLATGEQRRDAWLRAALAIAVAAAAFVYCHGHYRMPSLPAEGIEGQASITISSLSQAQSNFGHSWLLQGTVKAFIPRDGESSIARGITYRMNIPVREDRTRPDANRSYVVDGTLKLTQRGSYFLSVKKEALWHAVPGSWSLAEMRYRAKQAVSDYIYAHIADTRCAGLLVGLVTGELPDRQTRLSLGRFGLQHLLAISGFHFAILAATLALLLGIILPGRWSALALLVLLSIYCLFLGYGPSVMRAYITASVVLIGLLLRRPARALNSMGVAMGLLLLYDPASCLSPGFQLSFLATSAILLLYQPLDNMLLSLWNRRPLSELAEMSRLDQHGYIILALCRQALALTLAVHLLTVPLCLYYFQQFPLLSLIFNVFFPFLISLSVMLFILGSAIHPILPWLGQLVHDLNSSFTHTLLNLTFNTPVSWDITLRTEVPSLWALLAFLSLAGMAGIAMRNKLQQQQLLRDDLAFI